MEGKILGCDQQATGGECAASIAKKEAIGGIVASAHSQIREATRKQLFVFNESPEDTQFVVEQIGALLESAQSIFHLLPSHVRDDITAFHNFEGSITHCLRAGITGCSEIAEHAVAAEKG